MAEIQAEYASPNGPGLAAEQVPCPECGYSIEFFSDEESRHCPKCGFNHFRGAASDGDT